MQIRSTDGLLLVTRPITDLHDPYLLINRGGVIEKFELNRDMPFTVQIVDAEHKYCTGWYDMETHTNHVCDTNAIVDAKFESCFACRKKTDFNPAFYNSATVSAKQQSYNQRPHTVYIAYFGNGLVKAGIMADSRGYDRLYEQGALWYTIVERCSDALEAHRLEERLIAKGLRNSVTKKQKESVLLHKIDVKHECKRFRSVLAGLQYTDNEIVSLLDHFFFGVRTNEPIIPFGLHPLSGYVKGMIGRFLVMENNNRLYGAWLDTLYGYTIRIDSSVTPIQATPLQATLF